MRVLSKVAFAVALLLAVFTSAALAQLAVVSPLYFVVDAGKSIRLDAFSGVNPDCSVIEGATARLIEPPRGGEVSIGREYGFTSFRSDNTRAACNRRRTLQTAIRYRATPAFAGTDQFVVEEQFPQGIARLVRFFVHVRPVSSADAAVSSGAGEQQVAARCSSESSLAAQNSAVPTRISFANHSREPKDIFWIDYHGSRVKYRTLGPGERLDQSTYLTHPWIVADEAGHCLKVVIPKPFASSVAIM